MTTALRLCTTTIVFTVAVFTLLHSDCAQRNVQKTVQRKKDSQKGTSSHLSNSVLERKIDSQLFTVLMQYEKGKLDSNVEMAVNINVDSSDAIVVDISAIASDSLLKSITTAGSGKVIYPSKEYRTAMAILHLSIVKGGWEKGRILYTTRCPGTEQYFSCTHLTNPPTCLLTNNNQIFLHKSLTN
jgi:hypothetical protein